MFYTHLLTQKLLKATSVNDDDDDETGNLIFETIEELNVKITSLDYSSAEKILELVNYTPEEGYSFNQLNPVHMMLVMDMIYKYCANILFILVCTVHLYQLTSDSTVRTMLVKLLAWIDENYEDIIKVYDTMELSFTTRYGSAENVLTVFDEKEHYFRYLSRIRYRQKIVNESKSKRNPYKSTGALIQDVKQKIVNEILDGKF